MNKTNTAEQQVFIATHSFLPVGGVIDKNVRYNDNLAVLNASRIFKRLNPIINKNFRYWLLSEVGNTRNMTLVAQNLLVEEYPTIVFNASCQHFEQSLDALVTKFNVFIQDENNIVKELKKENIIKNLWWKRYIENLYTDY